MYNLLILIYLFYPNTDLLLNMFDFLFNFKIVRKEIFLKWAFDKKQDRAGNTIALLHMKRFLDDLIKKNEDTETVE